jgi:ketosteroid isomerase-like protein
LFPAAPSWIFRLTRNARVSSKQQERPREPASPCKMVLARMANETTPVVDVLRRMYIAFNRRDVETVLQVMHPDVDWPNALEGTRLHGRDAVRDYWKRQFESLNPTVEPQAFTNEPDGRIAIQVHQVVRDKSGQVVVDQMIEHVYAVRDGLIANMEIRNPKH